MHDMHGTQIGTCHLWRFAVQDVVRRRYRLCNVAGPNIAKAQFEDEGKMLVASTYQVRQLGPRIKEVR